MIQSVLVAGASIEGLCLAHGLRKRGISVTVYERKEKFEEDAPKTLLRIDKWGFAGLAACLPAEVYDLCLELRNSLDHSYPAHYDSQLREARHDGTRGSGPADRGTVVDVNWLRRILFTGLEDNVRFGCTVNDYQEKQDEIRVDFAEGGSARGDVLVLADGANSEARKKLIPDFELIDTGISVIHSHVPFDNELFADLPENLLLRSQPILGPRRCAMVVRAYLPQALVKTEPVRSVDLLGLRGYVKWTFVLPSELGPPRGLSAASPAALARIVMEQIVRWHPSVRRLLEKTETGGIAGGNVRASAPLRRRRSGMVTALGAAARVVPSVGIRIDSVALHDAGRLAERIHTNSLNGLANHDEQLVDEGNTVVGLALDDIERNFRAPQTGPC